MDSFTKKLTNFDNHLLSGNYTIPDSNLSIPRALMPQINYKDYDEFKEYLKWEDYKVKEVSIKANKLKVTQKDILIKKVDKNLKKIKGESDVNRVLWISKDNYILDGQHWFIAVLTKYPNNKIKCLKVNCNIFELLELARRFPKTVFKHLYENKNIMVRLNDFISEDYQGSFSGSSGVNFERLSQFSTILQSNNEYSLVRFAYDDDGNNMYAIINYKRKKVELYGFTLRHIQKYGFKHPSLMRQHDIVDTYGDKEFRIINKKDGHSIYRQSDYLRSLR